MRAWAGPSSKAERQIDKNVRGTLLRALTEYINGPEAPTSGDELTYFITREVMREFAPRVMLVNFWDMDVAHWGSYSLYLSAVDRTDRLTGMLWDEVQSNPKYKDNTTMLVLPELGRDGDMNTANGFLNHRSGDPSCRNIWMLAMGAGVPAGEGGAACASYRCRGHIGGDPGDKNRSARRNAAERDSCLMFSGTPKVSPVLQALIDKGLFDRLPVTFSTFFFDQIKEWDLLFPAEQGYYERLFSPDRPFRSCRDKNLFAPLITAEQHMGVNEKVWPRRTFTLDQVDLLNRSPHYPEWRKAVVAIFAHIDPLLDAEIASQGRTRLVIVVSPADLPVGPDRMWTRLSKFGKRVALEVPAEAADYLPLLLTGQSHSKHGASLLDLTAAKRSDDRYAAWSIETGDRLADINRGSGVVRLSYTRLEQYRARLMNDVQHAVDSEQIRVRANSEHASSR